MRGHTRGQQLEPLLVEWQIGVVLAELVDGRNDEGPLVFTHQALGGGGGRLRGLVAADARKDEDDRGNHLLTPQRANQKRHRRHLLPRLCPRVVTLTPPAAAASVCATPASICATPASICATPAVVCATPAVVAPTPAAAAATPPAAEIAAHIVAPSVARAAIVDRVVEPPATAAGAARAVARRAALGREGVGATQRVHLATLSALRRELRVDAPLPLPLAQGHGGLRLPPGPMGGGGKERVHAQIVDVMVAARARAREREREGERESEGEESGERQSRWGAVHQAVTRQRRRWARRWRVSVRRKAWLRRGTCTCVPSVGVGGMG
jgi:hypothetical protein